MEAMTPRWQQPPAEETVEPTNAELEALEHGLPARRTTESPAFIANAKELDRQLKLGKTMPFVAVVGFGLFFALMWAMHVTPTLILIAVIALGGLWSAWLTHNVSEIRRLKRELGPAATDWVPERATDDR